MSSKEELIKLIDDRINPEKLRWYLETTSTHEQVLIAVQLKQLLLLERLLDESAPNEKP